MKIKDVTKLMNTFANNKVKANIIQFDIKSNSINIL